MRGPWLVLAALLVLCSFGWTCGQVDAELEEEQRSNATKLVRRHAYMASLRDFFGNHFCTGVLVDQDKVLTAAHCLDPNAFSLATPNPVVHIGLLRTDEVDDQAMVRRAVKMDFHPQYNGRIEEGFDVAILTLDQPVDMLIVEDEDGSLREKKFPFLKIAFRGIQKSPIRINAGDELALAAYGRVSPGAAFSPFLERAFMKFIPNKQCNKPDRRDGTVLVQQMCAGDTPGEPCLGDDGGPLMKLSDRGPSGDLLIGLVSLINDPCGNGDPVIFTKIFYEPIRQWIQSILIPEFEG